MRFMSFLEFIAEAAPKHIEDIEIEDGSDKELEAKVLGTASSDRNKKCPRCGERELSCSCPEDDFWSTQTYHRVPKGKIETSKPKQNFKEE